MAAPEQEKAHCPRCALLLRPKVNRDRDGSKPKTPYRVCKNKHRFVCSLNEHGGLVLHEEWWPEGARVEQRL